MSELARLREKVQPLSSSTIRDREVKSRIRVQDDFLRSVQRIVNKHHGRVWVESEKNKGATFYFTLPKSPVDNS
jgi:signal transduction histidine kinase